MYVCHLLRPTPTDPSIAAPEDNSLLNGTQDAVSSQIVFKSSHPRELDYFTATAQELLHPTAFMVKSQSVLENYELDSLLFDCVENQSQDTQF